MPFRSEAQRRFMFSQHPEIAKEFQAATPKDANLPEHVKKLADGGKIQDEPGIQDATVSDFLLPYLLGPASKVGAEEALPALEGLGETGAVALGRNAPKMEEAAEEGAPKIEAFVKGIQKGPNGDVKIWGVKGPPELLKSHFGDEAPGSVPEDVLRAKGILPQQTTIAPQNAPNPYAEGGPVERSSLEHPVPNAMMARAMNDGGYPHVTFLENESPAQVKKDTHMEGAKVGPMDTTETGEKANPEHMAEGGKTPHFLEGLKKGALHKEMGVPEGEKIPAKKLEHASNSDNETLRKRAQFAINAKKWHHAEGGEIQKAEGRDKEPAKPANINMSHENKLASIYKAMGIKKYADGGAVDNGQPTNTSTPSPSDPTYWDQIKAALSQVTAPITGAVNAAATPLQPAVNAAMPLVPPAVSAVNKLTGADLPVPTVPTAPATPAATVPPAVVPVAPPSALPLPAPTAASPSVAAPAGMPNLNTIFNQDTSKLTAGVNAEDRQALVSKLQEQQHGLGAVIAQAVSGLGDALAAKGGKEQHSLQNIFGMEKQQRDEALANFDQARQDRIQKLTLQTQMGDNALKQAAAADAYGVDDHLNGLIGAPKGTMKKDLNTYFQIMSAQVAKQEKDADLYMKAHAQAGTDVDNAVKNASVLGMKPSAAQLQASGAKLADQYYNRAKGNILVRPSDGGQAQWIPAGNIGKAKQMDPGLQIQP
jgi:hypothetical protein